MSQAAKKLSLAERADKHWLYEKSVQDVEVEVELLTKTYEDLRGRKPLSLREDFCGTANLCREWIQSDTQRTAIGVDIDASVLTWGKINHMSKLDKEQKSRLQLIEGDVLTSNTDKVDINVAMNFSYWLFKTRDELRNYFIQAKQHIKEDGIFMLDCFGGSEAFEELKEKTKHKGFTYVWHQAKYNPVNGDYRCHIHFKFPDGSRIKKAFTYEWRLWTLPEIQELLKEAGFSRVDVYWEDEDDDGDGLGTYTAVSKGLPDAGWVSYLVAQI
ncbi:MAG: class I SAM-dependent methyltransferase [Gammaproteobacteria bacterium]|nr:class I SAM-dependent methyltransferase [Gammaproteobacteria bacterium]NNC96462.1 class I SAM-dependent methyltransferase [Gammaproteobacteria bacterium]NNM14511.1 class I SAM-dependent methyltransferase [Gammaproteobacteria bacterium]